MSLISQPSTPSSSSMSSRAMTTSSQPPTTTSPSSTLPRTPQPPQTPFETPSPGSWRHPKFDEISRRQRESTFTTTNLRKLAYNTTALLTLLYASSHITLLTHPLLLPPLLLLLAYNILTALLPLLRPQDPLTDIPLTPTQRSLLGLDPSAPPPPATTTPGPQYITPPRYPRSPTPRNASGGVGGSGGYSTPMSRKGSPRMDLPGGSKSSSSSPLGRKGNIGGGGGGRELRRYSSGTPSPLGLGMGGLGAAPVPGTPSPVGGGRGTSVGLNSKWLYERGRSSSMGMGGKGVYS